MTTALTLTFAAAFYAAGWPAACLFTAVVFVLWRAGEPTAVQVIEADVETRLRRELARRYRPTAADHYRKAER